MTKLLTSLLKTSSLLGIAAALALSALTATHISAQTPAGADKRIPPPPSAPSSFNSDLYRVDKQLIESTGQVSDPVKYRIRLEALQNIERPQILEKFPPGLIYVAAQPAPTETSGDSYVWHLPDMPRGTVQEIVITVRPNDGGWFVPNTKVAVIPTLGLPIFAGRPQLELTKTGPQQAELGDNIEYQLTVTNVGTATAPNVVVTDTLPPGLYGPDRSSNVVVFQVGSLPAGESRVLKVPVKAGVKGEWDNRANAYSTHEVQSNATAHVSIVESKLTITKSGPGKAYVFGGADYTIILRNDGDTIIKNIELLDEVPDGAQVKTSSGGGELRKRGVFWIIPQINPGETITRTVELTANKPLVMTSVASATFGTGRTVTADASTTWEGAPGVLTEVSDDVDPVKVDGKVVYTIKITNQSPMSPLTSDAVVELAPNLRFVEIKGAKGVQNGQRIRIDNISLKPRASITFTITAVATAPGFARVQLEFGNGVLPRPVVKEESTTVF